MELLWNIVLGFFAIMLGFNFLYMLFFSIMGHLAPKPKKYPIIRKNKFAIFMPSYKGDEVILSTAVEALKQDYPKELFDVIVIADSLKPETISTLKQHPLIVVEVAFENSTKGKSLNAGIKAVEANHYDYAIILDIDNVMEDGYLTKLNERLQLCQQVIQTHRAAKNADTQFSVLDGISEEVNNHIFRKGHQTVGLSAALIGSGKALQYPLFVLIMREITAVGGFDKEMEILLISRRIRIDYADDIYVYDEKVQLAEIFQNQRRRWMSAQLVFMRKYALKGMFQSLITFNIDYLDKCIQLILLPRVINLGLTGIMIASYFINPWFGAFFFFTLVGQIIVLLMSTPKKYFNQKGLASMARLPYGFFLMFMNLFKLKGANKKFIHTPHLTTKKED
jgi:cellulose synthase/poly-beta-1,6-N-acetylglucosamine synthase-like glycosyltransferase